MNMPGSLSAPAVFEVRLAVDLFRHAIPPLRASVLHRNWRCGLRQGEPDFQDTVIVRRSYVLLTCSIGQRKGPCKRAVLHL